MPNVNSLNAKQAKFVREYQHDCNASQAAIRAGYSPNNANVTGSRLLTHVGIIHALSHARLKLERETAVDAKTVVTGILAETCAPDATPTSRVAAWALLAKHTGILQEARHNDLDRLIEFSLSVQD